MRLTSDKQGYDVPVDGDWVTIAVVAERGPLRYSRAPVGVGRDGQEHLSDKEDTLDDLSVDANNAKPSKPEFNKWKGKGKEQAPSKPTGKKYVNLKLIDFGCRSSGSSTSGKSVRGDAFLSLLLFESDRVDEAVDENGKKRKIYRGGSKGAFEKMSKLREGAVVAFMNPRILKPFQVCQPVPKGHCRLLNTASVAFW